MRNTIIVEFNGLPGLGKTTVANAVIKELENRGYKTTDRHYKRGPFGAMVHYFPWLFSRSLFKLVLTFANSISPEGKRRTHVNWTNSYAHKYKSIVKHSNADFAIIDEAIIQFLVAMAFQDKMPVTDKAEEIVKKLKAIGVDFIRVDCVNDVEEATKRIMSRPSRGLVFESMQHDELVRTLEVEAANFDYLRSVFSKVYENQRVITIDTVHACPNDNAQIIIDQIIGLV